MMYYGHDQAVLLAHYARKNKEQIDPDEIVNYVFDKIKDVSMIFKS